MARGIRTSSGRGGRVPATGGGYHGTSCPESCCGGLCAFAWFAPPCTPTIENPPPECAYKPPLPLLICTTTTCEGGAPLGPGTTVIVGGQCYTIVGSPIRPGSQPDLPLYSDPTIPCVSDCSHPDCVNSPYSRAAPCDPAYPPLWFCRAQVTTCVYKRVHHVNTGFVGCYKFDPNAPPSQPPPNAIVCEGQPGPFDINIFSSCDIVRTVPPATPTDPRDCCKCEGSRCNHVEASGIASIIPSVTCVDVPPLDICCPGAIPPPAQKIRVNSLFIEAFSDGQRQETSVTGDLLSVGPGCPGLGFSHTYEGGLRQLVTLYFPDGTSIVGSDQIVQARACFCPLTRVISTDGFSEVLPPARPSCDLFPDWTCTCLGGGYSSNQYSTHWRMVSPGAFQTREAKYTVTAVFVSPLGVPCKGRCFTAEQQPGRPGPIGIIPAPTPGAPLAAEGSDGGTITIRGGGSRDTGKVNVAELL